MNKPKYLKNDYDSEIIKQNLGYDPASPSGLVWIVDKKNQTKIGSPAGTFHKRATEKYKTWSVELFGKSYSAARLVMALNGKNIPEMIVDHIDGDASNNCLENLRMITHPKNTRNAKTPKTNTSGFKGVSWWESNGSTYAVASWKDVAGIQRSKIFSTKKYGLLPAFKLACEYRISALRILNKENDMGYTERHIYGEETNE